MKLSEGCRALAVAAGDAAAAIWFTVSSSRSGSGVGVIDHGFSAEVRIF